MAKNQDLGKSLQTLANRIVEQALVEDVPLQTRLECLKVAGSYHLTATKVKLKQPDEDEGSPTFDNFKKLINGRKEANA